MVYSSKVCIALSLPLFSFSFRGGDNTLADDSAYFQTARTLWNWAIKANRNGIILLMIFIVFFFFSRECAFPNQRLASVDV
jgi:hypothetical protein